MTCQYRGIDGGDRMGRKLLVIREGRAGREYIICDSLLNAPHPIRLEMILN